MDTCAPVLFSETTARLSHTNLNEKYHSDAFLVILYNGIHINVDLLHSSCPGLVVIRPCDPHTFKTPSISWMFIAVLIIKYQ